MGSHKPPLVYQHLENIPIDVLVRYKDQLVKHIRGKNGVYALYKGTKLYYVGLAKNLRSRLRAHQRNKHTGLWDRCSVYLTTGDSHLREIEALVMRIAAPKGNSQRGKLSRSEDLMKTLKRDLMEAFRAELDGLSGQKRKPRGKKLLLINEEDVGELAQYTTKRFRLKARVKGKTVYARVLRGGRISYGGTSYASPSGAGKAATGRSCNGWAFWTYQKAKGYWVTLSDLRE